MLLKMVCKTVFVVIFVYSVNICVAQNEIDNHNSWRFIPTNSCGETRILLKNRIIGGHRAALGELPWMARIGRILSTRFGRILDFFCGGTLISRFYVLSAAHCYNKRSKLVRLGENSEDREHNCDSRGCAPPPQDIRIGNYIRHYEYSKSDLKNDIMLIQLRRPAKFNDFVMPVCLPRGELLNINLVGEEVKIAGWGHVSHRHAFNSPHLLYAFIPVIEITDCEKRFKQSLSTLNQYCAGFPSGIDSCGGDSGGPMLGEYESDNNRKTYVFGIVSYGLARCGHGPAVYTKVTSYMKWILDSIRK